MWHFIPLTTRTGPRSPLVGYRRFTSLDPSLGNTETECNQIVPGPVCLNVWERKLKRCSSDRQYPRFATPRKRKYNSSLSA